MTRSLIVVNDHAMWKVRWCGGVEVFRSTALEGAWDYAVRRARSAEAVVVMYSKDGSVRRRADHRRPGPPNRGDRSVRM